MEKRLPMRIKQDNPVYAGLVEQTDDAVGHVLKTLDSLNLDKNTVVVFVSDKSLSTHFKIVWQLRAQPPLK